MLRYHTADANAHSKLGVLPHVHTCAPFFYSSETTGPIGLKFCTWPGIPLLAMLRNSNFRCRCTCARAHPFFCISETTGPIGLKFCTQSGIPQLVMVHTLNFRCHCTCARAHPFLYLGNYWDDWAEIFNCTPYLASCLYHALLTLMCISGTTHPIRQMLITYVLS